MQINEYFKNLSKTLSGNFLAMLGFVVFSFTTMGAISRLVQGIVKQDFELIKGIFPLYVCEAFCYLPITCLLAIVPFLMLLKFLMKPKYKLKTQIIIILCIVILFTSGNFNAFDYRMGTGVYFALVIGFGFPVIIIFFLLFLVLFFLDLNNRIQIKNNELINNIYYNKIVNISVLYLFSLEGLIILTILILELISNF